MSLAEKIFSCFRGHEEFSLNEAYASNPDKPKETVRARIYENLGIKFERIAKGIYKTVDGNDEVCIVMEGDGRDLSMLKDNSIDCILTDHPWLDIKSNRGGTRAFATYECFKYTLEDFQEKARVLKDGCFLVEILPAENENNYEYLYQIKQYAKEAGFIYYAKVAFGKRKVGSIKYTDVKEFYLSILQNDMMKASTLESIHTVVRPSMQLAVRNDIIMKNPCNDVMAEIKRSAFWEKDKRHALTEEEQDAFLQYLAEHEEMRRWYIVFTVLIGTGMRLGEFSGLRWDDVDFEENYIDVNHQAVYYSHGDRKCRWGISIPKTENGVRIIPMLEPVREALLEEYEWQKEHGFSKYKLDGYSGFVFTNRFDNLYNQGCLNKQIERIRQAYNREEEIKAKREKRRPLLLPHFTNHQLRHTFCSRLCEQDVNVKLIQEVMGHADISTTFDIYAEFSAKKKKEAFKLLDNGSIIKTQKKAKQDDDN